jgi:hypothetical protein
MLFVILSAAVQTKHVTKTYAVIFAPPTSQCQGVYQCIGGVCLPQGSTYTPVVQEATATPPVTHNTTQASPNRPASNPPPASSPPPQSAPNAPAGPEATNTPFPTRIPVNKTFYNNTNDDSNTPQLPKPTPIPEFLKGKSSTIIVEMPSDPVNSANPSAPVPAPTPLILKGEDMKVIKIGLAKASEIAKTPAAKHPLSQDLDITIQAKKGLDIAINQQEFVIQKGVHTVTISANERRSGTLLIEKNDTHARITMPVSIDPTTNILTVDTPQGPMKVSIMPDDALAIIRQLKVIDKNKAPSDIVLESNSGSLQYKVIANKEEKLLGMLPLSVPREVYVSADTGSLMKIKQSALWNFVTLFTF